jgi:hypothetical protein
MSGPSSSSPSWSKFFKQAHNNHKNNNNNGTQSTLTPYPYSDNPFHRPPSAAGTYSSSSAASEATFRTGSQSTASNNTIKPQSPLNHLQSSKSSFHSSSHTPPMSSHDLDADEAECPVCLEPLSFSFRLPGEKPHVVPECGHALHEVSRSKEIDTHPLTFLTPLPPTGLLFGRLWSRPKS